MFGVLVFGDHDWELYHETEQGPGDQSVYHGRPI